jgi:hypothetical protein
MTGPPRLTEIELSLFGPGFGESVVIHIGGGKWIIVDSCVQRGLSEPTPLAYLRSLGVSLSKDVVLVVASHWHDDHIRGLYKILEECSSARFACSSAMVSKQFVMLGQVYASSSLEESGVNEFQRIHSLLEKFDTIAVRALANRKLWEGTKVATGLPFDATLYSLSPSDEVVLACEKELAAFVSTQGNQRRVPAPRPNHLAVVLQLIIGKESILLGSDLENHPRHGWQVIVGDKLRSQMQSSAFKVAHHGSVSGHHDQVWQLMLDKNPYAFLTPLNTGTKLPSLQDIQRIRKLTNKAYITADPDARVTKRPQPKEVERTLKEAGIEIRPTFTSQGQIRFRFISDSPASRNVSLFHGARTL